MQVRTIVAAGLVVLSAAVAEAQISELPANQQLIDSYALSMDNIRKIAKVDELIKGTDLEKSKAEESDVEEPLSKQWQKIEKADTTGVLRKAGISARDYLMTITTVMQTTIDVTLNEKPRSATNTANIELLKKNRAEIERIMK